MLIPLQDFFYICSGHLTDRGFCQPEADEAKRVADQKKQEELDREIEAVKKEYEEKQKLKREKRKAKGNEKEEDKNILLKTQRERDEWKQKAEDAEKREKVLHEQIGQLQKEATFLVAKLGKTEFGLDLLKQVREEAEGTKPRQRASSRGSAGSKVSVRSSPGKTSET